MDEQYYEFNPKLFNPLYWHIKEALRNEKIRYIFVEGGSSAAKTYSICQALTLDMLEYEYSTMVFRRQQVDIADSVYKSFGEAIKGLEVSDFFDPIKNIIRMSVGDGDNVIRFKGLDDEENIKGIESYNVIYNNEWSQFLERHFQQQRKRLRGRANQKFICDWNPISSKLWQYEKWIDLDTWKDLPLSVKGIKHSSLNSEHAFKRINAKGDTLWIKVTFRDNFWIVGHPSGRGGFKDVHTLADFERDRIYSPNMYRVYANGERGIIRTGGEFWKKFDETKHVKPLQVDKSKTIHVSLDQNQKPYVTTSIWQVSSDEKRLRQIDEIPCYPKDGDNNAPKAAKRLVQWLNRIEYNDIVYIYGDPSSGKRAGIDENNSSFYDKYIEVLEREGFRVVKRVGRGAPQVALSAAFVNEIYEHGYDGWEIEIADKCKVSVDDYIIVKEGPEGEMLKPKIKDDENGGYYEPNGHFSDAKRYFVVRVLETQWNKFKARGRRSGSVAASQL